MWPSTLKCVLIRAGMPYAEFLAELSKAGLSVRAFAELMGMNPNSISNYAHTSELPTHLALIAVLIVGINEMGGDYRRIISRVPVTPKKPRGGARRGHFGGDRQNSLDFEP
jgi:transcriptional regulator with XRE-family HTH domain